MKITIRKKTRIRPDVNLSSPIGTINTGTEIEVEDKLHFGKNYIHEASGFSSNFWYKEKNSASEKYYWEGCGVDLDALEHGAISLAERIKLKDIQVLKADEPSFTNALFFNRIAIIDTGFDLEHPDLKHLKNNALRFDCSKDTPSDIGEDDIQDTNGHGTTCLGIVGAKSFSNNNLKGIFPHGEFHLYRITNKRDSIHLNFIERALDIAIQNSPDIISISWGISPEKVENYNAAKSRLEPLLKRAYEKGIFVFCAANLTTTELFRDTIRYPASSDYTIAVGHFEWADISDTSKKFKFSSQLDFVFPATENVRLWIPKSYKNKKIESSFGTVIVSGLFSRVTSSLPGDVPFKQKLDKFKSFIHNIKDIQNVQCSFHITPFVI